VSLSHHPADAILADYAAGRMRPGFDLVVGAHLERCAHCRARVGLFEAAAGDLMQDLEPAELSDDALAHALARLERDPVRETPASRPARPRRLHERLPLGRKLRLAPGVWVQPVDVPHERGDRVYLLRVGAGLQGLHHGHHGAEFTTVLEGALVDGEAVYGAGDFCETDADVVHQPKAGPDGPCLCLIATEGRIRPLDLIGRAVRAIANV
jgi:putative transcriptional regulator